MPVLVPVLASVPVRAVLSGGRWHRDGDPIRPPEALPGRITVTLSFSHFGICVSDLERSLCFYCEGLGFEETASHRVGDEFAALMELEGVALESRMIARDGVTIELLGYLFPEPVGDGGRRPMNQLGLTHLSLRVDDVDTVASTIGQLGGTVVGETRTTFDLAGNRLDFLYCTDPDGVRIELMHLPD